MERRQGIELGDRKTSGSVSILNDYKDHRSSGSSNWKLLRPVPGFFTAARFFPLDFLAAAIRTTVNNHPNEQSKQIPRKQEWEGNDPTYQVHRLAEVSDEAECAPVLDPDPLAALTRKSKSKR